MAKVRTHHFMNPLGIMMVLSLVVVGLGTIVAVSSTQQSTQTQSEAAQDILPDPPFGTQVSNFYVTGKGSDIQCLVKASVRVKMLTDGVNRRDYTVKFQLSAANHALIYDPRQSIITLSTNISTIPDIFKVTSFPGWKITSSAGHQVLVTVTPKGYASKTYASKVFKIDSCDLGRM